MSRVWLSWAGAGAASLVLPCWGVEDRKAAPVTTTHNYNPTLTLIICVDCTSIMPEHSLSHTHAHKQPNQFVSSQLVKQMQKNI